MAKLTAKDKRLKWWREARFGMFIHWGLYTATNLDCWNQFDMGVPSAEYAAMYEPKFTGRKFDADAIMKRAKSAGFKYVVMGSRHHEGYCLWDTDTTSFSSAGMTPNRDFIGEFTAAARKAGLKVGLYYSLLDWRSKAYWLGPRKDPKGWRRFVDYCHAQVRELMTRYGKIDILWYDGAWHPGERFWGFAPKGGARFDCKALAACWRAAELNAMVRRLQKGIIINNRSYLPEDYNTPETTLVPEGEIWEFCSAMSDLWGCSTVDKNRKTPREIITTLLTCVEGGGNYLLNISPKCDGTLMAWQVRNLERVGRWLGKNGEAVYGCTGTGQMQMSGGLNPWKTTQKGSHIYMHLLRYPGTSYSVGNMHEYYLLSARMLVSGKGLKITHRPTCDVISGLPARAPDDIASVVKIKFRRATAAERRKRKLIYIEREAEFYK